MSSTNTVSYVSVGKPKVAGAIYMAAKGTTLPADSAASLSAYTALGYVSEDGVTNTNSPESDTVKAWGGDTVLTLQTSKEDKFKFTLIESLNADVLKAVYGSDNVSGALATGLTVHANSTQLPACVWVIDMVLTDSAAKRIVIPEGQLAEVGDIVYKDDEAIGYEITINALPSSTISGDTHIEYIKAAASGGTGT